MERIIDSQGKRFMSEFLTDLPDNTMLNKVLTGCGGTTVALSNDIPYVICVPFRAMITNKLKWASENGKDICPVMGGISDNRIGNYKGNKYMVTYDSLHRLNEFINPKDFKILIDESHKLIDSGSFRNDAVDVVLDNYKKYGSYVFMTATPVKDKYQLPELVSIPKAKIKWYDIDEVYINYTTPLRPLAEEVAIIVARHLTGIIPSNAHVFLNSVNSIIDIIESIDPDIAIPQNINIVCANNDRNIEKLEQVLGDDWTIKNVGDVAKVNFYTSTAFEGSDIYDEDGKTYIVTDGLKDYTKNDILTTLPQIIGRIRDTQYKNYIDLIFTSSPYYGCGVTEEDYERVVKEQLCKAEQYVELYNNTELPEARKNLYKGTEDHKFIKQFDNNVLKVNYSASYNEMHSFEALHTTYYAFAQDSKGKIFTTLVNDTNYNYGGVRPAQVTAGDRILLKRKINFSETLKYLIENIEDETLICSVRAMHPEMMDYIKVLGTEKIKALKYRRQAISQEYTKANTLIGNPVKIVRMLNFHINQFITIASIKDRLTHTYKELGITKPATASDIKMWYEVREKVKRNKKTKVLERGYEVMLCKVRIFSDDNSKKKYKDAAPVITESVLPFDGIA
jgi:hypothetical protein